MKNKETKMLPFDRLDDLEDFSIATLELLENAKSSKESMMVLTMYQDMVKEGLY